MARQKLNNKNVLKLSKELNLPIVAVLVRGGTGHRRDLCLEDGSVMHLYKDGSMELSDIRHSYIKNPEQK